MNISRSFLKPHLIGKRFDDHTNENISKAQNFVGYAQTHDIYQGMEEAIEWYIENISGDNK